MTYYLCGGKNMTEFLLCIVQYVLIAIVILAVGFLGAFVGYKMRQRSNAKKAAAAATEE